MSINENNEALLWDMLSEKYTKLSNPLREVACNAQLTPDRQTLMCVEDKEKHHICFKDLSGQKKTYSFQHNMKNIAYQVTRNGHYLLVHNNTHIKVWDMKARKCLWTQGKAVQNFFLSADESVMFLCLPPKQSNLLGFLNNIFSSAASSCSSLQAFDIKTGKSLGKPFFCGGMASFDEKYLLIICYQNLSHVPPGERIQLRIFDATHKNCLFMKGLLDDRLWMTRIGLSVQGNMTIYDEQKPDKYYVVNFPPLNCEATPSSSGGISKIRKDSPMI